MERLTRHIILLILLLLPVRSPGQEGNFREAVWLRTDRSIYLAGEEVRCRLTLFNATNRALSDVSSTVRLELFNQAGIRQSGKNIRVTNSSADHFLELAPGLPGGWYFIRAYTGYMMNFGPGGYAVARIRVVNPADPKAIPELYSPPKAGGGIGPVIVQLNSASSSFGLRSRASVTLKLPEGITFAPGMEPEIRILPDEDTGVPAYPLKDKNVNVPFAGHDYFPDITPGILQGHVRSKSAGKPAGGVWVGLSYTDSNRFDVAETDSSGRFLFNTCEGTLGRDYILTFISEPDSSWEILVCPVFDERPWQPDTLPFGLTRSEQEYVQKLVTGYQLRRLYQEPAKDLITPQLPSPKKPVFFDPPERTIHTSDYIELANVREVVYEVVPDVNIRRQGENVTLSVYNKSGFASAYPTLIMLDGIPITRHGQLLELLPERISEIEVKNRVYIHGRAIFSSIVNFVSKNHDFAGLDLPETSVTGSLVIPILPQTRISMDPAILPAHIPILDPVLYIGQCRGPSGGRVEFMTGDRPGIYRAEISGIDVNGRPVYGSVRFEVKLED